MKVTEAMRLVGELVKIAEEIAEEWVMTKAETLRTRLGLARSFLIRAMAEELHLPSGAWVELPGGIIKEWAIVEKAPYGTPLHSSLAIERWNALIFTGLLDAPESREDLRRVVKVLTNEYKVEKRRLEDIDITCLVFSLKGKRDVEVADFWLDRRIFTVLTIIAV